MARWLLVFFLVLSATRSARASSFNLGFALEWRRTNLGERAQGMVFLTLPLERFARPRVPALALARGPGLREGPVEPAPAPTPVLPAKTRGPARPATPRAELVDSELARRLVRAALRVRGAVRADERLDGLSARSRASSVLPELMLRAVRSTDESLRLSPSGTVVNDYTQTGGAGLLLEARATWKLDRLLFADEELRVERLRAERERSSERVVASVLKLLFTWHRARAHLAEAELTPDEQLRFEVEQLQAEAELDVLTDGLFSSERRRVQAGFAAELGPSPPPPAETPGAG